VYFGSRASPGWFLLTPYERRKTNDNVAKQRKTHRLVHEDEFSFHQAHDSDCPPQRVSHVSQSWLSAATCASPILVTPPQRLQTSNYWTPSCRSRNNLANQRPQHPCLSISHLHRPRHLGQPLSKYHHACLLLRLTPFPGPSLPDPSSNRSAVYGSSKKCAGILNSSLLHLQPEDDVERDIASSSLCSTACCCACRCLAITIRLQGQLSRPCTESRGRPSCILPRHKRQTAASVRDLWPCRWLRLYSLNLGCSPSNNWEKNEKKGIGAAHFAGI
jgi:hypothetical protein